MSQNAGPISNSLGELSSASTMWQALRASRAKAAAAAIFLASVIGGLFR
jgi:hypothetical protein